MNKECCGLKGKLLGHNFIPVFDIDEEQYSSEETTALIHAAKSYNFWMYGNEISANSIQKPKRITKVFRGSMCTRCGQTIENEQIKI